MENQKQVEIFIKEAKEIGLNVIENQKNNNFLYVGIGENETDVTKGFYYQIDKDDIKKYLKNFDVDTQKAWLQADKHLFKDREYQYEMKNDWIEKMDKLKTKFLEKDEELAIYAFNGIASNELYPTMALTEEKLRNISIDYYNRELEKDDYSKITDLIKIKTKLHSENKEQGLLDNEKDLAKKVDEKIIEHICEKYYSNYENAEADQKNFKENNIRYDDNGFIESIKPIGSNEWILDIIDCGSVEYLDRIIEQNQNQVKNTQTAEQSLEKPSQNPAVKRNVIKSALEEYEKMATTKSEDIKEQQLTRYSLLNAVNLALEHDTQRVEPFKKEFEKLQKLDEKNELHSEFKSKVVDFSEDDPSKKINVPADEKSKEFLKELDQKNYQLSKIAREELEKMERESEFYKKIAKNDNLEKAVDYFIKFSESTTKIIEKRNGDIEIPTNTRIDSERMEFHYPKAIKKLVEQVKLQQKLENNKSHKKSNNKGMEL